MKQLIEKLKNAAYQCPGSESAWTRSVITEAADAIERLENELLAATIRIENDALEIEMLASHLNRMKDWKDAMRDRCAAINLELEKLKQQEPVAWAVTVGHELENCVEITSCKITADAYYKDCIKGGNESIYHLQMLYLAAGAQPPELADADVTKMWISTATIVPQCDHHLHFYKAMMKATKETK